MQLLGQDQLYRCHSRRCTLQTADAAEDDCTDSSQGVAHVLQCLCLPAPHPVQPTCTVNNGATSIDAFLD